MLFGIVPTNTLNPSTLCEKDACLVFAVPGETQLPLEGNFFPTA